MKENTNTAKVIYLVLVLGLFIPFTNVVAIIFAYINKGQGSSFLDKHYRYQIRTFWIGIVYIVISSILTIIFIGYILLLLTYLWTILRCLKGFNALQNNETPKNVTTWWI